MKTVFNSHDLPGVRLQQQAVFAADEHESIDGLTTLLRSNMARQLAEKIINQPEFFKLSFKDFEGTLRADCVVMTQEEYCKTMLAQFRNGVNHANHFIAPVVPR